MATKTSYHQQFHKKWHIQRKGYIQSKLSLSSTTEYEQIETYFTLYTSAIQTQNNIFLKFLIIVTMATGNGKNGFIL